MTFTLALTLGLASSAYAIPALFPNYPHERLHPRAPQVTGPPPPATTDGCCTYPGYNHSAYPMFQTSGNWTNISVSDPFMTDATIDGPTKWNQSGAPQLWTDLMNAWTLPDKNAAWPNTSFSDFVYQVFAVSDSVAINCASVLDGSCSTPPSNDALQYAAVANIFNSIFSLHSIFQKQYNSIDAAQNQIGANIDNMYTTFAQQPTNNGDAIFQDILDVFNTILSLTPEGALSKVVEDIGKYAGKELVDQGSKVKDWAGKASSFMSQAAGSSLLQATSPPSSTDVQTALDSALKQYSAAVGAVIDASLGNFIGANDPLSRSGLTELMQSGFLLNPSPTDTSTDQDIISQTSSVLYGKMIPATWSVNGVDKLPFILRVDASQWKCGTSIPSSLNGILTTDMAKSTWCDASGNQFILLNGKPCQNIVSGRGATNDCGPRFTTLTGGDNAQGHLDGTSWGGLTIEDIVLSSFGGFQHNNGQNGYSMTDTSLTVNPDLSVTQNADGLSGTGNVRTPGFFNFTICLDYEEALKNLDSSGSFSGPVCGTKPQAGSSGTAVNMPGSFEAGTCGVHIVQYQKDESQEVNPLNSYQLQVTIKDNGGLEIGDSTKESSQDPLMIVDSVLPYDLIVATGKVDSDPISFWYSNQYWTSNDKQCSVGGYDSGDRQMDCSFSCPMPSSGSNPPASATQPLPSDIATALPGTVIFTNTWTSSTPQPTATTKAASTTTSAKPTPTYATGNCGVHVEQFQKNEAGENPTGNYEVEVTLYDGKGNPIGSSGQVPAPSGVPVVVTGLVSDFNVTCGGLDSDPVSFSFGTEKWNSDGSQCKVGSYDGGNRNMDCGYSC